MKNIETTIIIAGKKKKVKVPSIDIVSLDAAIALFILPRIKLFRIKLEKLGIVKGFDSELVINEIEWMCEQYANNNVYCNYDKKFNKRFDKATGLMAKYFRGLWV